MRGKEKREQANYYLPVSLVDKVEMKALQEKKSRSAVVLEVLSDYFQGKEFPVPRTRTKAFERKLFSELREELYQIGLILKKTEHLPPPPKPKKLSYYARNRDKVLARIHEKKQSN